MKTLKQILNEEYSTNFQWEKIQKCVRKWLQQKRKEEYKNWYKELNEILRIIYRAKNIMINEFLEELDKKD